MVAEEGNRRSAMNCKSFPRKKIDGPRWQVALRFLEKNSDSDFDRLAITCVQFSNSFDVFFKFNSKLFRTVESLSFLDISINR